MMFNTSLKTSLVAYLAIAMGALFWQLFAHDFFAVCEFNAGACSVAFTDYGRAALAWPVHLIQWRMF